MPHQENACRLPAVRIVVDDREARTAVVGYLVENENTEVSIERLPVADYRVGKTLLVERKSTADFRRSVLSGRLFRQINRLIKASEGRGCLLIEGYFSNSGLKRLPRRGIQGAIVTVSLVYGIPVLRSRSPRESAFLIVSAGRQLQRRQILPLRRPHLNLNSDRRTQIMMLQTIPGVGPHRALGLLKDFGNLQSVVGATEEDLAATNGVGKKTAQRIRTVATALEPDDGPDRKHQ